MNYDALIFDMDGTLVHNMPIHNQALLDTLVEAALPVPADLDEFFRSTYGRKNAEILQTLAGGRLSAAELAIWDDRKEALYRERFACCREPLPGLLQLLDTATGNGLPMAVASAAPPENIAFILDELDLRRYFKAVVGGHDVQRGKPHPDIFLKSAQMLGVEPQKCLVFEDAVWGIEAARHAGMQAVMLTTTLEAREAAGLAHVLHAVPDFTHLNLQALLGPPV
jgi:beta-phosphoglucomutase family hydrolase